MKYLQHTALNGERIIIPVARIVSVDMASHPLGGDKLEWRVRVFHDGKEYNPLLAYIGSSSEDARRTFNSIEALLYGA